MTSPAAGASSRAGRTRSFPTVALPVLALVALISGCSRVEDATWRASAQSAPRPSSTATAPPDEPVAAARAERIPDDWRPEPLRWAPCSAGDHLECATLTVPLDWSEPDGSTLGLALARTPASGPRIGSLLSNPGGPGASGIDFLSAGPFAAPISERFDLVSWDPRGVGRSEAPRCGSGVSELLALDPEPDDPQEQADLDEAAQAVARECGATDGELLPHVGTTDVARDLEAIRRALGDEPLNYVGFSYGTQIGQEYADMYPEHVRAMVLDGVVDPALGFEDFLIGQAVAFDGIFERNAEACAIAGPATCGVADLAAAYDSVEAQLERRPLQTATGPVGPAELATAAVLTGYYQDGWFDLGPALAAAAEGDGEELRYLAESYWDFGGYTSYAAVVCIDTPPPRGRDAFQEFAARAEARSPRFGAAVANELLPCATWPAPPAGAPNAITAPGAAAILVIGNTGDPATPYENATAVADRLESGVLVTAHLDGHTAYGSNGCVTSVVDDYLVYLTVPDRDPNCT